MSTARITLTFLVDDFDDFVEDWMTDGTTEQDAANLALGDLLDESMFDLIDMGIIGSHDWTIEYPAQESTIDGRAK